MKTITYSSYEEYVKVQTERNKEKLGAVFATDTELLNITGYIKKNMPDASFGICHGVRNGYEVIKLREFLNIEVIGTEISETADKFPHVIQWDFHEVKDEWVGNCDFIYSNSWDHSYDFKKALDGWMSCLKSNGRLFLTYSETHNEESVKGADCFGATVGEMVRLISENYYLEEIIPSYNFFAPEDKIYKIILRTIKHRRIIPTGIPVFTLVVSGKQPDSQC